MERQVLTLKGPIPQGVLARLALMRMARTEVVRVVDGPFPRRHDASQFPVAPAAAKPMSAKKKFVPTREFKAIQERLHKQQERAFIAHMQLDVAEELAPCFRHCLDDRPGADYLDKQNWWLGRRYYRSRSSKCWKNTRDARYQYFIADRYRSA